MRAKGFEMAAAAALAAASPQMVEASPVSNQDTESGSQAPTEQLISVANTTEQITTEEGEEMEGRDENNEDSTEVDSFEEEDETEDREYTNWNEQPTPPSFSELLNESAQVEFNKHLLRFREYAASEELERAAYVLISPEGDMYWVDQSFSVSNIQNEAEGNAQTGFVSALPDNIEQYIAGGYTLVEVHTHPSTVLKPGMETVPPSPIDLLSSHRRNTGFAKASPGQLQGLVISEGGDWRYGFKSLDAVAEFEDAINSNAELLARLEEPALFAEFEVLLAELQQQYVEYGDSQTARQISQIDSAIQSAEDLHVLLNSRLGHQFTAYIMFLCDSLPDSAKENIEGVLEILETVEESRDEALSRFPGDTSMDYRGLHYPPNENEATSNFFRYTDKGENCGAYMEFTKTPEG